jgi:predicted DNA-binding transcriptional regulator AlpA
LNRMQIMGNDSLIIERVAPTILIGRGEVLCRTGLKKSKMYGLKRNDKFPHQVQKSENTVGWVEAGSKPGYWNERRSGLARLPRKPRWHCDRFRCHHPLRCVIIQRHRMCYGRASVC